MGRKRKVYGQLYAGPRDKPVRMVTSKTKWPPFPSLRPAPRGKTGSQHPFTVTLKELAPFVYAFIVDELKKQGPKRDLGVREVIAEWRQDSGSRRLPQARELAAFVIERAMEGAWQVWGIKPPYSEGDADNFLRRYVHGHRHALRDYRKALQEPQPWPRFHRGHWLKCFFGARGEAARQFNLLTTEQEPWTVVTLCEEEDPQQSR